MKSEKAEKYLFENGLGYPYTGYVTEQAAERAVELAEREAEERMRKEAVRAFCAANCPKGCSFGADGNIGCGAKARFIQKLNENEND